MQRHDNSLRFLWLARDLPCPLDTGSKVYSAHLATSLARAGAHVRLLGHGQSGEFPPEEARIEWVRVPDGRRRPVAALAGALPIAAAVDATAAYRRLLGEALRESWDAIVFDNYGSGWALPACVHHARTATLRPVLVHVSHNHEAKLWAGMARNAECSPLKRLALSRNAVRIAKLERSLVEQADVVTAITDEDRLDFGKLRTGRSLLTLSPGYSGERAPPREITPATPRRVLLMGSFTWVVKRENLMRLIEVADPAFERAGIALDVLGEVPPDLLSLLGSRCKATHFHGFVGQTREFFTNARIGVVPELIGGGFKLKFLDYFFSRLPVATIADAAAGLPVSLRKQCLQGDDLESLVSEIVGQIDNLPLLNEMQREAFELSQTRFRWEDRGQTLLTAVERARRDTAASRFPSMQANPVPAPLPGD